MWLLIQSLFCCVFLSLFFGCVASLRIRIRRTLNGHRVEWNWFDKNNINNNNKNKSEIHLNAKNEKWRKNTAPTNTVPIQVSAPHHTKPTWSLPYSVFQWPIMECINALRKIHEGKQMAPSGYMVSSEQKLIIHIYNMRYALLCWVLLGISHTYEIYASMHVSTPVHV